MFTADQILILFARRLLISSYVFYRLEREDRKLIKK